MRTPESSGSSRPPVSPKLWNTGSALRTMSRGLKSTTAASWCRFASRLRWLSTTPFGVPSEPDVKSTTAGSLARAGVGRLRLQAASPEQRAQTLANAPISLLTSSR